MLHKFLNQRTSFFAETNTKINQNLSIYICTLLFDSSTLKLGCHFLPLFLSVCDVAASSCVVLRECTRCMWCQTPACSQITRTFFSSGEASHRAASLARLLFPNYSEHDHATEQLHAHLWQTASASG